MLKFCKRGDGTSGKSVTYEDLEDKSFQSIIRRTRAANGLVECVHSPMRLGRGSPPPKPSEAQPVAELAVRVSLPSIFQPLTVTHWTEKLLQTRSSLRGVEQPSARGGIAVQLQIHSGCAGRRARGKISRRNCEPGTQRRTETSAAKRP